MDDLKKGPVKIPNVIATGESAGTLYTDASFYGNSALWWDGFSTEADKTSYSTNVAKGTYSWHRWKDVEKFKDFTLFDKAG